MQGRGPMRSLLGNSLQVVVILLGRDGDVDEAAVRQEVESRVEPSVTVTSRQARFTGDKEVVVTTRTNILLEDQVEDIVDGVRDQIIQQNLGFEVQEWRVEAT